MKKPTRKEIVAKIVSLQEEAVAKLEDLKGKPVMRRKDLENLRQVDYWSTRFQLLMDLKYFVDPDTVPRSVVMEAR